MFSTLLPAHVQVTVAEDWMWNTPVSTEEEAVITRAVDKRRREFRAGRHAARKALAALDIVDYRLLPGKGREPRWPDGVVGAITHTGRYCAVAVTDSGSAIGLGIDAEQNDALKDELRSMICTPVESEWVSRLEQAGATWASKLVFSAKECIHKVYYPLNHYTLDFLDAELDIDTHQQCFRAKIIKPYKEARVPVYTMEGRYAVDDHHVYAAIYLPKG